MVDSQKLYETDPRSVRGILDAYEAQKIDYPTLVSDIVDRFVQISPVPDDPARAGWSQYMQTEMMPGDDDGFWLSCAVSMHILTPAQLDEILDAIHAAVHGEAPARDAKPSSGSPSISSSSGYAGSSAEEAVRDNG